MPGLCAQTPARMKKWKRRNCGCPCPGGCFLPLWQAHVPSGSEVKQNKNDTVLRECDVGGAKSTTAGTFIFLERTENLSGLSGPVTGGGVPGAVGYLNGKRKKVLRGKALGVLSKAKSNSLKLFRTPAWVQHNFFLRFLS